MLLKKLEENWETLSMIGVEALVESRRMGISYPHEAFTADLESVIDFLCHKYDTTGDMKYLKELKQLIKENETHA